MTDQSPTRRAALAVAGVSSLTAVAAVSGCSSDAGTTGASGTSAGTPTASSAASPSTQTTAIEVAQVPVGGGAVFPKQKVVVTQPQEGTFKAFSIVCPHQGCPVSTVTEGTINCLCHGSSFDLATGEPVAGPAKEGLDPKTVTKGPDGLTVG